MQEEQAKRTESVSREQEESDLTRQVDEIIKVLDEEGELELEQEIDIPPEELQEELSWEELWAAKWRRLSMLRMRRRSSFSLAADSAKTNSYR